MDFSTYELTRNAIRSRLLMRTEAEYRDLMGVTGETIRDRRDDREAVRGYFNVLDRECRLQCDRGLASMMRRYTEASAAHRGEGFDWMERRQLASRKKFCRWLFRRGVARGVRMSVGEESRFRPKACDEELLRRLYPEGIDAGRTVDVVMLMLITFGVVRPFDPQAARSRDISVEEARRAIVAMKDLVELLRDDTPQMGVTEKPVIYEITIRALERMRPEDYTAAVMWEMLNRIEDSCIAVASPQGAADSGMGASGYSMPGIWVDDADGGRSRFWVFPENMLMAFCFSRRGGEWEMDPMEFIFMGREDEGEDGLTCSFITARGNEQILNGDTGIVDPTEVVTADFGTEWNADNGEMESISFEPLSGDAPLWMDWKEFRRLPRSDGRLARFREVIAGIYTPGGRLSAGFRNRGWFMTDIVDALIALDGEYLYVSARPAASRYLLRPVKDSGESYEYVADSAGSGTASLRDITISEEYPLYLLPRRGSTPDHMPARRRRFVEACRNTGIDSQVTVYHTPRHPRGILCFNKFSVTFALDDGGEEIISYGAIKITDRKDFFK